MAIVEASSLATCAEHGFGSHLNVCCATINIAAEQNSYTSGDSGPIGIPCISVSWSKLILSGCQEWSE